MTKPEERTYKIDHKGKNYLIQIRSDKGQWLTDKEAQEIITTFNVESFQIEALTDQYTAIKQEARSNYMQMLIYKGLFMAIAVFEIIRIAIQ